MARMQSAPRRLLASIATMMAAPLVACGYHSTLGPDTGGGGAAGGSGSERSSITVVALRSDSPEPWLDRIVTDALRREFGGRARLRLADDAENADLQIRGRIRPLDIASRSFSSFVAALEYSLTLELDLEVRLANGDVIQLDPTMLSETESYLASPDIEVTRTNRLEALRRMSDQLASRVADSIELIDRPIPEVDGVPDAVKSAGG
jgi:outer membrane lipopolysaccharide assembly protein LptE/RlpB